MRSCDECQQYVYQPNSNKLRLDRQGKPLRLVGRPPCYQCPKCQWGESYGDRTPTLGRVAEWQARHWRTWELFWQHRESGGDVDAIQRRNFGIIAETLDAWTRAQWQTLPAKL